MSQYPLISIVDDDEAVRSAMESLVRSLGFRASCFASAGAFLGSERLHDTACLIADVQMPGMSGVELQAELGAHGCRIPIIFITAFPEDRIRRQVMAAGAVGFLGKPFDGDTIVDCIDRALAAPGGAAPATPPR